MFLKRLTILLILLLCPSVSLAALQASTVWEIRQTATANNVNGGGYTSGGTDYTQQDAAQLNNTDFATSGVGVTTLTSVTGNLTSAMVGNLINLQNGTNLTPAIYEITAFTNANTVTLDRAPDDGVGGISSTTGYVGGAISLNSITDDDFFTQLVAGNKVWIKYSASSYLFGETVSVGTDGTGTLPIVIEGYNTTRGDEPTGADRPTIAKAANDWVLDNYWKIRNLIVTTTSTNGVRIDTGAVFSNMSINNSSGSSRPAFYLGGIGGKAYNCEGVSNAFAAFRTNAVSVSFYGCYAHDSVDGFYLGQEYGSVINCVTDTNTDGIDVRDFAQTIIGNTIYNNTNGIRGTTATRFFILGNIIDSNTDGFEITDAILSHELDWNNWTNNTRDISVDGGLSEDNTMKGPNATALSPGFDDAANGDFDVGTNMKSSGPNFPGTVTGLTSSNTNIDQGAVQRVEPAGGGGGGDTLGMWGSM